MSVLTFVTTLGITLALVFLILSLGFEDEDN